VDPEVPIEEVAGVMGELVQAGKVLHFGLSEPGAASIRSTHSPSRHAVQSEYSLWTRNPEPEVLATCGELGIGCVPFSPGKGFFTGTVNSSTQFAEGDVRGTIPRFTARTAPLTRPSLTSNGRIEARVFDLTAPPWTPSRSRTRS
jgi:aryl-alcohol dehydrogenase-like predicted oxidoreductase